MTQQGMTEWNPDDPFDLGIWTQSPPKKKAKKSLSLKVNDRRSGHSRFESPKKPLETYQERFCPENTKVNTRWAVKNFEEWAACLTSAIQRICVHLECDSVTTRRSCLRGYRGTCLVREKQAARNILPALFTCFILVFSGTCGSKRSAPFRFFLRIYSNFSSNSSLAVSLVPTLRTAL